ncbi:hypothetical protein BBK36DRAFT_151892 [Trichoderma citrinoviride]|uniref:Uncharacterized protein n=1 Tax=Trichoderma citrinoviride TaxID=58853 RepID=A0A2T4BL20_9HYPO|nr:hypothetical protein BBK36DRAFT_151892 [Trichoderma citrinoviride]PTB69997.1 hypothetical protein BBK36DRAFT_151892 [Trichoderma citrinoviride]
MPPKPGDKQISKPPQQKFKLSSRGLQLALDLSAASTASAAFSTAAAASDTAVAGTTADSPAIAASPPSSRLSGSGSGSVSVLDSKAHEAQRFIHVHVTLPISHQ